MPGTLASLCRPALTVLCHHFGVPSSLLSHLGTGSGMEPCPASSSNRIVNTEHINQLSCLHAQSFKISNLCSVRPSIILSREKVAYLPCRNFVRTHLTRYPRSLYLGASLSKAYIHGLHAQNMCDTSTWTFYAPSYASIWLKFWPSWVAWLLCLPLRSRLFG